LHGRGQRFEPANLHQIYRSPTLRALPSVLGVKPLAPRAEIRLARNEEPLLNSVRKLVKLASRDNENEAAKFFETVVARRDEMVRLLGRDGNLRVLDVGCGECYPATILFSAWGWNATGIDIDPAWRSSAIRALSIASRDGIRGVLKKIAHECLRVRPYHAALVKKAKVKMPHHIDVRHMSVAELDFPDAEFDLIHSHAVLEHVQDMDLAMNEMARVLSPTGVAYHLIHLFASLSGGHDPAWRDPDANPPADVPPWNHLRTARSPNIGTLNKLRESDYRELFEKHFHVVEWRKSYCGQHFITPDVLRELPEYTEEELLTETILVTARKRAGAP
jgi:SAM-dependent methyltransferase